jgi:hypothetical protein
MTMTMSAHKECSPVAKIFLSGVIAAVLGVQGIASTGAFVKMGWLERTDTWPFIDYALFREAYHGGDGVKTWKVQARGEASASIVLDPLTDPTIGHLDVRDLTSSLLQHDTRAAQAWCDGYRMETGVNLTRLQLIELEYRLDRTGFHLETEVVTASLDLPAHASTQGPLASISTPGNPSWPSPQER